MRPDELKASHGRRVEGSEECKGWMAVALTWSMWSIGSSHDAREIENSLGIPHVLGCFDLQVSGFFGERRFDIGHDCF